MKRQRVVVIAVISLALLSGPAAAKTYFEASILCPSSGGPADRVLFAAKSALQATTIAAAIVRSNARYNNQNCAVLSIKPSELIRAEAVSSWFGLPW